MYCLIVCFLLCIKGGQEGDPWRSLVLHTPAFLLLIRGQEGNPTYWCFITKPLLSAFDQGTRRKSNVLVLHN